MIYKGLYRTSFIVILIIALVYLGLGLINYIDWQIGSTYYSSTTLFTLLYFLRAFLPFIFALATIIFAMFALVGKEFAAILTIGFLLLTYSMQEVMNFLIFTNVLNRPNEVYFFNPLILIGIITVALLSSFTLYQYFHHK